MKDTLRLKILWTRIKIRANSFIETLVNNMKQKINEGALNRSRDFPEHCTKIDISLVFIRFFFSQTNLVFKSNPLFINLLIFTFILRILKFIQCLYVFFIKTSKVLIRFNVLFVRFSSSKCCYVMSYFPWKKILPVNMELLLTAKINPGHNTCTCRARAAQFSAC